MITGPQNVHCTTISARFISFRRGLRVIHPRYVLLRINNVASRVEAEDYVGNGVFFYKSTMCNKSGKDGNVRTYGVITKVHGKSGVVCAKFSRNLNPKSLGGLVFVSLYKVEKDEI